MKKILIISGGFSKKRKISLDTGKQVFKELKNGLKLKSLNPMKIKRKITKSFKPDVIFNALHGRFGEDGYIQSILENINIPYAHSFVIASAKAMDKIISKEFLKKIRY